jgi:hypothetical protein
MKKSHSPTGGMAFCILRGNIGDETFGLVLYPMQFDRFDYDEKR